jgi:hypothetical protein
MLAIHEQPMIIGSKFFAAIGLICRKLRMCSIDFGRVVDARMKEERIALQEWYKRVSARPSAKD